MSPSDWVKFLADPAFAIFAEQPVHIGETNECSAIRPPGTSPGIEHREPFLAKITADEQPCVTAEQATSGVEISAWVGVVHSGVPIGADAYGPGFEQDTGEYVKILRCSKFSDQTEVA
jgi:hypothetical protein